MVAGERTSLTAPRAGVAAEVVAGGISCTTCHRPPTATPASPSMAGVVESRGEKIPDIPATERERERGKVRKNRGKGHVCIYIYEGRDKEDCPSLGGNLPSGGCFIAGVEDTKVDTRG